MEEEDQELNTPVKENKEYINETKLDENENNRKTSDCETHQEKDIENMEIEAQKEENRNFDAIRRAKYYSIYIAMESNIIGCSSLCQYNRRGG